MKDIHRSVIGRAETLSSSAWAVLTKYHRLGGLKTHLFLTVMDTEKSKDKVPACRVLCVCVCFFSACWVLVRTSWLMGAAFLYPHMSVSLGH